MRLANRLTLSGLMLAALFACSTGCSPDAPEIEKAQEARPVKLLVVETTSGDQTRRFPALVQAADSSDLAFQVSGQIEDIQVSEAQEVKKGAVLAQLDVRDLQSSLDAAKAQFESAESEFQRALRLEAGDEIAKSTVEQRKSSRDTARAQLDAAEKAVNDSVIRAPFDGVVAKVHASERQTAQAGSEIVTMISGDQREVVVDLPASVVALSEQRGADKADIYVILDAAPGVRIPATFTEASLEADTASQTFEVTFGFQPPEDLVILPGMSATVVAEIGDVSSVDDAPPSVSVPLSAVQSEADRNFVWVIDSELMQASKRWVTIQPGVGESVVILDGLEAGETIAGAGGSYLAEGMSVRAWTQ